MYSTPGEYLEAIKQENVTYPTNYDDSFPFSDKPEQYWSGFYSSRPSKKKQVRDISARFHASQNYLALQVLN